MDFAFIGLVGISIYLFDFLFIWRGGLVVSALD